jgi:SAM-dependent methyltransferase
MAEPLPHLLTVGRSGSFGQQQRPSPIDRLGIWLSARSIRRHVGTFRGLRVVDVGCGYQATFARSVLAEVAQLTLLDLAIAPDLHATPRVSVHEGELPATLASVPTAGADLVVCINVLEHLWDDELTLAELHRIAVPGGCVVVNVPSWRGKVALETSAFRLGLSPREEMDDHKRYYDPRDLWPLLVKAGFQPHDIRCRRHKFGLNTLAVSRARAGDGGDSR